MSNLENNSVVIVLPATDSEDMSPSNYEPVHFIAASGVVA